MTHAHLAARVFNVPLLLQQSKASVIARLIGDRADIPVQEHGAETLTAKHPDVHAAAMLGMGVEHRPEGHFVVAGHTAIVPIIGTLIQRSDMLAESSGMTSYARVSRQLEAAFADSKVQRILLEVDSPGGEVAGAFDLADRIFAIRSTKPITAVASELAASAAYLIASAASEVWIPRTGMVGSIGVVVAHYDYSKALEKRGVAVTFIYAGEHKVDGNPYQPLPASVQKELQTEIDRIYGIFVDTVARNRGMTAAAVRKTQAAMFMGQNAVDARLADRVGTFQAALDGAASRVSSAARASAILGNPEAIGRRELAQHLVDHTTLSAEEAIRMLAHAGRDPADLAIVASNPGPKPESVRDGLRRIAAEVQARRDAEGTKPGTSS